MSPLLLFLQICVGLLLAVGIFLASLVPVGNRSIGVIENIDGIPYPVQDDSVQVTEKLAHADIFLKEPVFAKALRIRVQFDPQDLETLTVGIRENSFWLSYPAVQLYSSQDDSSVPMQKELIIPLTDKLQEADRSVDLMFFATTDTTASAVDEGVSDSVVWDLQSLEVETIYDMPTLAEVKDYVKSVIYKERAL